jgi:hypothetical protein
VTITIWDAVQLRELFGANSAAVESIDKAQANHLGFLLFIVHEWL